MGQAEQITRRTPPSHKSRMRRSEKRAAARARRRAERKDPENAPAKMIRGLAS